MILKAGTYKFNDNLKEVEFEQEINFTAFVTVEGNQSTLYFSKMQGVDFYGSYVLRVEAYKMSGIVDGEEITEEFEEALIVYTKGSWDEGTLTVPLKTYTLTEDTEVDDTFGAWYIDNTNYNEVNNPPLAEITYNGEIIAKINAGETVILKCEGLPMETDIIVKVNG